MLKNFGFILFLNPVCCFLFLIKGIGGGVKDLFYFFFFFNLVLTNLQDTFYRF